MNNSRLALEPLVCPSCGGSRLHTDERCVVPRRILGYRPDLADFEWGLPECTTARNSTTRTDPAGRPLLVCEDCAHEWSFDRPVASVQYVACFDAETGRDLAPIAPSGSRVRWEIDVDQSDPVPAAAEAATIMRDAESIATVFEVTAADGTTALVDLLATAPSGQPPRS